MNINYNRLRDGTFRVSLSGTSLSDSNFDEFKADLSRCLGLATEDFYLTTQNGKLLASTGPLNWENDVELVAVPRLLGGKGGFGSMLRAIGAQIEKTTNRDACRDLSGRRLRDINEEQRLKRWFAKQKEREEEKAEAKKRKLEKLRQLTEGPPLPKIDDQEYNKIRAEMADSVYEAVDKGFEASLKEATASSSSAAAGSSTSTATATTTSSSATSSDNESSNDTGSGKQRDFATEVASSSSEAKPKEEPKKKAFKKTMFDEDLDSCTSSEDESDESAPKKAKLEN